MNIQRLSAFLLIASFIVPAAFFFVNVPGYYQTQDIAERVRLVDEYRNLWNAGRILSSLMVLLSTAGVGLLILHLRQGGDFLVAVIGALSYTIGSVFYALVIYTQGADLIGYLEGNYPDYHGFGNWFWLAGLFLLGTAFLKAGFPTWLSYLTIGTAVVLAIVLLMSPGLFFIVPFLAIGLLLVVGIVVLRR